MNTAKIAKISLISVAIAYVLASSTVLADDEPNKKPHVDPSATSKFINDAASENGEATEEDNEENNEEELQTIAVVNGKPISSLSLDRVTAQLAAQGQNPDRQQIIQELINLEILTQEAERLELDKNSDVAVALQLQYTQTMANAYLGEFNRDLRISEEEIRAKYEEQIAAIKASEYKASHIILDNESDALNVINELAGGGNFAVLAETYSTGPTGVKGGDLGWFQPENMEPEFSAALAELEIGETTSEPVKTKFGWHVIQLDDLRSAAKPDYSPAVKAGIQNTLLRDAMARKVDALRSAATIEIR